MDELEEVDDYLLADSTVENDIREESMNEYCRVLLSIQYTGCIHIE